MAARSNGFRSDGDAASRASGEAASGVWLRESAFLSYLACPVSRSPNLAVVVGSAHHPGRVGPAALPGVPVPDEPLPQAACTSSCQQICPPAFTASRASRRPADCGSGRAPSSAAEANPRLPTNEPCCGCRLESARLVLGEGEGGGASPSIAGSRRLFDHTAEGQ